MKHKVFLNDGIIETIYDGEASILEVAKIAGEGIGIATKLIDQGEKVKSLVDVSKLTTMVGSAYKLGLITLNDTFGKIAIVGAKKDLAERATEDIKKLNKSDIVSFFESRAEALKWLNSD